MIAWQYAILLALLMITRAGGVLGEGAVEAFDFAVGLGPVAPNEGVVHVAEGTIEGSASVAGTVVGES